MATTKYTLEIDEDTEAVEVYRWEGLEGTRIATVQFPSFDPDTAVLRWDYPRPGFAPRSFASAAEVLAYVESNA